MPTGVRRKDAMRRTVAEHQKAVEGLLRRSWAGLPASIMDDGGTILPLAHALGRVLASDLVAPLDLPPFPNSQMDGYAVAVTGELVAEQHSQSADSDKSTTFSFLVGTPLPPARSRPRWNPVQPPPL
ncbi:hypothetical protein NHF46_05725 [Arthrobacter alpinus]|nr:hypothetical protein [Arthrobacter alpinus]